MSQDASTSLSRLASRSAGWHLRTIAGLHTFQEGPRREEALLPNQSRVLIERDLEGHDCWRVGGGAYKNVGSHGLAKLDACEALSCSGCGAHTVNHPEGTEQDDPRQPVRGWWCTLRRLCFINTLRRAWGGALVRPVVWFGRHPFPSPVAVKKHNDLFSVTLPGEVHAPESTASLLAIPHDRGSRALTGCDCVHVVE
jgi:hypothetical protein